MVGNICMLTACRPVIYYRPFSVSGPTVSNINPLTVCWPVIYHTPFSASGPTVSNINPLITTSGVCVGTAEGGIPKVFSNGLS